MPVLPPIGTLQAADQINTGPEPDRMNIGAGQTAPMPIPGQGRRLQDEGQGSGFSKSFESKVLGAPQVDDPAHLNMFSGQEVFNPRYSSVLPGEDSEESFAKAQPWYKKWANATIKMGATAAGTFYNGIAAIPDAIAGIKNGENPFETSMGNGIDKWLNNLEDQFPNYYTKWEQTHPFLSAIPFSGGAANFWSDKFLKNLGFTIGAIGGAAVQDLAIGALTEGIGEIPMVANQVGRAALWLNKIFTGSDRVGELLQLGRQAGRTEQQLLSLTDLARASQAVKVSDGFRFATNLYGAAASEAGFEARDGYNTVKKDLTDDYIKANGYAPVDKEADDIEKSATASANVRFGINLALLGLSDAIQFDAFLKPFSAAKAGYRGALQKEIEEGIGHIGLKEGSLDEFERVSATSRLGKIWDKAKPYIPAFLSEGVYEEGGQYAAQIGTQNYYERKYLYDKGMDKGMYKGDDTDWNAQDQVNNIIHSTLNGMSNEFGSTEGLENIFLGAITGVFSAGVEHFMDRKENTERRKEILDLLNKQGVTGTLKNVYDNTVSAHRIAADMKAAAATNNIFKYKNLQHEQFVNFILSGLKADRFDLRMAQLDLLKDMPEEKFKQAFGLDKSTENKKLVSEYVDSLKEQAEKIKRTHELISETFNNPYSKTRRNPSEAEQLENEKYHEFEEWKDHLSYLSSIADNVRSRKNSIDRNIKKIDGYINPRFVQSLTNPKEIREYSKVLKTEAKGLEENLKNNLTSNRAEDSKKLAFLTKRIAEIDEQLTKPTAEGNAKLFETLLNYQLNGEKLDGDITIPKGSIPSLINMGIDLNRLDEYKKSANDAFDILSSKKGFDKYFDDVRNAKKAADDAQQAAKVAQTATPPTPVGNAQQTPGITPTPIVGQTPPVPAPPPTPPAPKKITVKDKEGKTHTYDADKQYHVELGEGLEPVKVISQGPKGILVQRADGSQVDVPIDTFFGLDEVGKGLDAALTQTSSPSDTPPPPNDSQISPLSKRGESKKDLSFGPLATTDPPYDDKTTPDDNYQRRHQNFLFNLGSSDPNVFNQGNKPKLRIIPITPKLQADLKLGNWITESDENVDTAPIRAVYVIDTEKGYYYSDGKGDVLGYVGDPADPTKLIYTNFASTSLQFGTDDRYTNKQGLDPNKVMDWWREQRKFLLSLENIEQMPIYEFQISRGIPNETDANVRNSLLDTGLIREEDLNKPIIQILTLGNVAINGALNDEGLGIDAHKQSVNMGDMGKPVFNFGGNMGFLDGRRFTKGETNNIFNLIKILADRQEGGKKEIFNYLHKLLYLPNEKAGKGATNSSISISGPNLYLGLSKTPILMNPINIENHKGEITAFLEGAFHNINNTELLRIEKNPKASDLAFNELHVKDGKVEIARTWENYNHYLLSNKYPDGSRRTDAVLTTKIVRPQEGEVPMIQKYSVVKGPQMTSVGMEVPSSDEQLNKLKELGWSEEQIGKMTPALKQRVIDQQITAEENRKMAQKANEEQGIKKEQVKNPEPALEKGVTPPETKVIDKFSIGGVDFGITNIQRDEKGNITDFDVLGRIDEKGEIIPPKDGAALKVAIMNRIKGSEIKPDPTTEEKKSLRDRLGNKDRNKNPDSQYRLATIMEPGSYTVGDMEKERAEVQKMIPNVPVHLLDHLIKTTGGGFAWGALSKGMIYLYRNAEVGTAYHEAFEATWNHFLTGNEQRGLYEELKGREGNFTTYTGETKAFSQATVQEAKEQMAEEFRDYKSQAKATPKNAIQRFFQRVIDFIKNFLLGDRSKINEVFSKLNRGDYRGYSTSLRDMDSPQYRRIGFDNMSESMIQDVLQGMTVEMFMDIFRDNQDIITQLEESPERGADELYKTLKKKLTDYFESEDSSIGDTLEGEFAGNNGELWNKMTPAEQDIALGQIESIRNKWEEVKSKWDRFVKEHKRYLKVFNVEYKIDDDGNISFADEDYESEDKSQAEFDRDIFQMDAKSSASVKIKLLIATTADSYWKVAAKQSLSASQQDKELTVINRNNSEIKLAKQAEYAKLFNYMLHNLSNINGIYDMWTKMQDMVKDPVTRKRIDANLKRVMTRIDFSNGFKDKTIDNIKMLLSLENTMSKQKPAFFRQFIDPARKVFFKTSTLNTKLSQVKTVWTAGMMASKSVTATEGGNFMFSKDLIGISDNLKFINKLGIPIDQSDYDRLKGKDLQKFNSSINKIRGVVEKAAKSETLLPVLSPREVDFNGRIDEMAEIYISNITGDDSQSQHANLDNEQTSNFVLHNYVSTVVSDANNSENKVDFLNKIDNEYFNDIFHQDSVLLNKIFFNKDGSKTNRQIEVGVVEGRQSWNGDNKSAPTLTEAERQLYAFNDNLNGVFYTLLPADAKTEWAINMGTYLSADTFFRDEYGRRDVINEFTAQMYQWLDTEVKLARDYENRKHIVALTRKEDGREIGRSLRFFKDLLDKDAVDKITQRVIDGGERLDAVYTEPELRSRITEVIRQKAEDSIQDLIDWNVIDYTKKTDTYTPYGFDNTFLATHLGSKRDYTKDEMVRLAAFREMNYVMNGIEMHKFFFGDPAQYKDELKRIKSFLSGRENTHVDTLGTDEGFNQVANEQLNKVSKDGPKLTPKDPGYHQFKNHFNTFTIKEVHYISSKIDQIEKEIGEERAKPYRKGDEADASAYMMDTAYREAMYKSGGRFSEVQEKQFQWYMAWERNDKAKEGLYEYTNKELEKADKELLKEPENPKAYFPILKLIHSGMQTDLNDIAAVSLDKASWAPLFYKWYKGTTLGKLHQEMQRGGVDYARLESAHKVGIQSQAFTSLYNEEGEFNQEGIRGIQTEQVSLKHIGVQVEQSKKEKGQTEGSQARKIAIGDLRSNGVPIDFLKGKEKGKAFEEWNKLTKEQKLASSPIYKKIDRHNQALRKLTAERTNQAMDRLGMTKRGDTYTVPDKKKVSDFILDELERRELPRNIAYGLDVVYSEDGKNSEFVQPLEANAQYTKIRSILYSVMNKTIMRPKVSGGQKTMLSVTGFEKEKRITKETVNGKPVYTSDTLKFYNVGKEGTEACEVMLPYWFSKQLTAAGSKRSKEEVIKYLNEIEEGKKLLKGIGFRIPTQGLNSIDLFKVKDFLPEQMGDVVVLPSEITAKAGSDFDIDKLNTYLRNFYIDNKTGYPIEVKWQGDPLSTRKYIEKLVDGGNIISAQDKEELDRYIAEEQDYASDFDMNDIISRIPGVNDLFSEDVITRDFLGNYRNVLINKTYMKALENEYFDSMEDLLSLPENYGRLVQPNNADQLKEDRNYIKNLVQKREGKNDENLGTYGKLLDSQFMMKERHAYLMSKGVVGPSAVSQTAHAVSQNLDGGLVVTDPDIVARFPHNSIGGQISLSGLTIHGSDQLISNVNSQTTDGGVDVAKDKFLAEMGLNKDTLTTYLAIRRMGAPRRWAELFINQPAIQRYLKLQAIHNSVSQINPRIKKKATWALTTTVYNELGFNFRKKVDVQAFMADKPAQYSMKEMEEAITSKTLTNAQKAIQAKMLDDYLKYNNVAWDLFHFYQGYNWDTARITDPNEMRFKQLKYLKANDQLINQRKSPTVSPVGKVMTDTFIGEMKNQAQNLDQGLRSLINVQNGAAGTVLDDYAADIFRTPGMNASDRSRAMLSVETSAVDFAVQTNALINGKPMISYINALLMGDKPIAKYIQAIKDSKDVKLNSNPFIKNLVALIDKRKNFPSRVELQERDYDTYTSNVWTDAFRELKDDATIISINDNRNDDRSVSQIYENLVVAAMLQSGSRKTSTSLSHLIPNESYSERTRDSLRNMNLEGFYENNVVYRTNWDNDKLVPTIQPLEDETTGETYYPFFVGEKSLVRKSLENQIQGNPAALLSVPSWQYSNNKAIKIRETHDVNGQRYATPLVRLFERVDIQDLDGGTSPIVLDALPKNILFKEINAWGDGDRVQEYHKDTTQSVLGNNFKIDEVSNDQLLYALNKAGYEMNVAENTVQAAIARLNYDSNDMDETGNPEPVDPNRPPGDDELQAFNDAMSQETEPEDKLDECGGTGFSVKNEE